jgi:SAM-dependent methyltransferase
MASETIYDHPLYYDILFGWDRSFECDFYSYCFERYGVGRDEPVLEVACGTGRVALLLAHLGWRVTGLDLNPAMLAFLEERSIAEGLKIETVCGDMASSTLEISFGAAFNPLSSFRLLQTDPQVEAHFHAMAANLRAGGIYVLDLELQADEGAPSVTTAEDWEMSRDGVTVTATNEAVHVDNRGVHLVLAWGGDTHLRGYTPAAFVERVSAAGCFRIEAWYPESTRETGVTEFARQPTDTPDTGRGMVVLRRL